MKVLVIRGKNLASLEKEFEVDFTVEPLKSAGIFAITGSTGSGKSTLLDTLCLALFDTSPRINHASENASVQDVGDKTIQQSDCRTILRRGATEGFAEVDFVSLGGETFRARWAVRRARNKVEGSLQSSEIRLFNLSTNHEEQGTKTELLNKISELIGLTFFQFTRSVLLAQGEFSAFLKAKQADKAELLEKLTGTGIFSQISVAVYEKTKDAESQYNVLYERFKGIELLSDEQISAFEDEKTKIQHALSTLNKDIELLTAQLKWLDEKERLCIEIRQAETDHSFALKAIEDAGKRFAYMARIESAQTIRDTFGLLKNTQKQLTGNKNDLLAAEKEREENNQRLVDAQKTLSEREKEQEALLEKQREIAPQIIKARALDVQITASKAARDDAQKEFNAINTSFEKTAKNQEILKKAYIQDKHNLSTLNQWLYDNKLYESVAPRTELLISLATDAQTSLTQNIKNKKTFESNQTLLETNQKQLEILKHEAERLNQALPAEIAVLRAKLIEGAPCPVCGSVHHPVVKIEMMQRMKEQELKKVKENNAKQIEILTTEIENRKMEITRLSTAIENYNDQYIKTYDSLALHLSAFPEWVKIFERGELALWLNASTTQWNHNSTAMTKTKEEIGKLETFIDNEESKLKEVTENLSAKKDRLAHFQHHLSLLLSGRSIVLRGKPAADAEKYFVDRQNEITEKLTIATDLRNNFIAKQESLNGIISRIQTNIRQSAEKCAELQHETDSWISENEHFTYALLTELFEKSSTWIHSEKQSLQMLTETETTVKATLVERRKNLELLHHADTKPENESKETIQVLHQEKNEATENQRRRLTEIEANLSSNLKALQQIKGLEKELNEKVEFAENWKKLNHLFGSATGNKFKEIAQGFTLEALLLYANKHLQELAPRYELQRISGKLALQVIDTDMLNEVRSIHSLSGGESFLVSLALALGLSSLSSNRMKIESLFIDEGFGSLDSDTLRIAMCALEQLHTQGRKIGVISHVAEMTERIPIRINVQKTSNNRSIISITGS